MQLDRKHFEKHFNDRIKMLQRSASIYDAGEYAEASRLASDIVKLIGDREKRTGLPNKNFTSLTTHLGNKPKEVYDSSLENLITRNDLHGPLFTLGFHINGATGLVPKLDGFKEFKQDFIKKTPFDDWWNAPVVRDYRGYEFSRKFIVETMRDQEEAHTDDTLHNEYAELIYKSGIGIKQTNYIVVSFDTNPARVVVRQVAHEILRTLVPEMQPIYLQSKGMQVQPIQLFQVAELLDNGNIIQLSDHKLVEFQIENTNSPEIWQEWQKFALPSEKEIIKEKQKSDNQQQISKSLKDTRKLQFRTAYINYAPYDIKINGCTIQFNRQLKPQTQY